MFTNYAHEFQNLVRGLCEEKIEDSEYVDYTDYDSEEFSEDESTESRARDIINDIIMFNLSKKKIVQSMAIHDQVLNRKGKDVAYKAWSWKIEKNIPNHLLLTTIPENEIQEMTEQEFDEIYGISKEYALTFPSSTLGGDIGYQGAYEDYCLSDELF